MEMILEPQPYPAYTGYGFPEVHYGKTGVGGRLTMITVGISDLNVAKAPDVLVTYALGSCVGICLYDSFTRVAGLSHIMLPSSTLSRDKSQPARYAVRQSLF